VFHIPTEGLERGKKTYEEQICRLENINKKLLQKQMLKETVQDNPTLSKHSYKDVEE
jgi:hypothetical protein